MSKFKEPNFPAIFTESYQQLREFDRDLINELGNTFQILKGILDRGISFDDNMDVRRVSVTSHNTPGTEFSVAHLLGKTPTGYIVYGQTGAGSIYDGSTTSNSTTLYLKSDASSVTFRIMVF
jgi:hypothetical protein